jgi:putative ABC transport system permease protein
MTRHFLKLIWNRRRANGLILLELTFCFVTLCGTLTSACYWGLNWNKPLGFEWRDLWRMDIDMQLGGNVTESQINEAWQRFQQLELELDGMKGVSSFTPMNIVFPYSNAATGYRKDINGTLMFISTCPVSVDALETLGLDLVAGRWFERGDESLERAPVVITRDYARKLFGDDNAVGKMLTTSYYTDTGEAGTEEHRIIGVVAEYRVGSEIRPARPVQFSLLEANHGSPPTVVGIRTDPGATTAFQERLFRAVGRIAPEWRIEVTSASRLRERELRANMIPLTVLLTVAGFLIIMVGLGLVGVLWHAITRRTRELGIRRAVGASEGRVRWHVLGELLTLTTVGVLIGSAMFLQFPILQVISWMPWEAYLLALVLSLFIIYPFVVACGLYPAWLATRIHPAQALQHE